MAFTQAYQNVYGFSEVTESDKQVLVTNNLGRTVLEGELVYLNGYFGNVVEYGGIANGLTGRININAERIIRTKQIEATDTFVATGTMWFVSGGSGAAGKLVDAVEAGAVAVGIITEEEGTGGAQTAVGFRPFVQRLDAADVSAQVGVLQAEMLVEQAEPKIFVQKVTTGAASITVTGLAQGDEIIDVMIIPTGASTNGTIKITDGTSDITNAMLCATDKTIARAATIDDAKSTLPAAGAKIVCAGDAVASTVAIVVFTYIPAAV
jgi:hypothetical protein